MRKAHVKSIVLSALGVCLASCAVSMLILLAVYAIRGIWPFGTDNVAFVDTAQFYLPGYYKIWDAFHGAPVNVNWTAGLAEGSNLSWNEYLWPPNIVFLLVSRDHVLEALSLYLAASLCITAFLTGLAVHLRFRKLHPVWQVLLTVLYTLSGYVLQYYSNYYWLYIAALLPLIMYALERLLRDGKYILYTAVFAYLIYQSIYFTYMVTAYILLFASAYALFLLPKELRGDRIFRLGVSTAAAFGLSAWSALSSSSTIAGTSRFQENLDSGLLKGFTTWDITATRHTFAMLLGAALALALIFRALRRRRRLSGEARERADRTARFFALILGMLAIPMVFTNIDAAWHFGQYNFFPMRYGFALPATLLAAAGVCLEREAAFDAPRVEPSRKRELLRLAGAAVIAAALIVLEPRLVRLYREYGTVFLTLLGARDFWLAYVPLFVGCGLLFTGLYLVLFRLKNRRLSMWLIAAAVVLQLGTNASGLIAPNDDHVSTHEYDPAYVETADSLYEYFSEAGLTALTRAKNVDCSLNAGYPAIAGVSAVSSVRSVNAALRLGVYQELGYTIKYFRIMDTGGTVLSDMMFGVDLILSAREPDASLYTDTGVTVDGIHIASPRYAGAIGLTFEDGALDGYLDELTLPGRLNLLYRAFTDSTDDVACAPAMELSSEGEDLVRYTLSLSTEEEALLYLAADDLMMNLTVNGEPFTVPSYQNPEFRSYPAAFNNNLLYLGTYEPGAVTVSFISSPGLTEDDFTAVALYKAPLDAFHADTGVDGTLVEGGVYDESVTVTLPDARAGRRLFLPLTYSYRWQITVNGQIVPVERTIGALCSVPLEEGENTVVITRGPARYGFGAGQIISLVTVLLAAAWLAVRRRVNVPLPRWAGTAAQALFAAVVIALFLFLYATPAVMFISRGSIISF